MPWPAYFYETTSWNLTLSDGNRLVNRVNREGSGIVYLTEELAESEACNFRVEAVSLDSRRLDTLSLEIGITTCDSSLVTNFPSHVIEPCRPSHDCEGHTLTIKIKRANSVGDEISMERKSDGRLQVLVNGETEFRVADHHDSLFPFSKGRAYPFLVLSGQVSRVRVNDSCPLLPHSLLDQEEQKEGGSLVIGSKSQRPPTTDKGRKDVSCVICMDEVISHMAVPCNHAAFCDRDANENLRTSRVCPVCRKKVTGFVRIFIP